VPRRPVAERLFYPDDGAGGRPVRRVRRGVDGTVKALRDGGRLELVDAGLVALARTLADAMDEEHTAPEPSRFTVGSLAGRLLPVLVELRGGGAIDHRGDVDAALAELSAALRDNPQP
jgi:hypothetical protein